ncbi:MAG: GlsB/YeaQ/YmgE family stress response membrane protein [Parachlamydia sp.]|jgi:uncharacterized membrane protein YeaQ/YmgE (transglycosylase-associated protein family)|nr:GlsB/YeaQ/YmgE family stress response membrane protein [Parachlamydia sp.]
MSIIATIIIGFVVGLIARFLMPGRDPLGFIWTTLLGIGGALIGQFLGQALGLYHEGEPAGFLMSLLGAMLLLFIYNHFVHRDTTI